MKQTLIQIIVAVVALAALAAVVYRAQSTAPTPAADVTTPAQKITLTNEPVFLPSTKTDAGAGARIKAAPVQPVEAGGPEQQVEGEPGAGNQAAEPEAVDITIGDEIFLPSTKAGPIIPAREEGGE